jgi:hypothetical protein
LLQYSANKQRQTENNNNNNNFKKVSINLNSDLLLKYKSSETGNKQQQSKIDYTLYQVNDDDEANTNLAIQESLKTTNVI